MLRASAQEDALRAAKAAAESANEMKTRFLANMSHELRTPLNAVIGFSEMLKSQVHGDLGDAKYAEYASDIYDSGSHLLEIINAVLDLSKVEAGFMALQETEIDVVGLINHVIRHLGPLAKDAGIELTTELSSQIPSIRGDETKLRQILINLLSNAIKFTPQGGKVSVAAEVTAKGEIHLAITDTGIGIAETNLPQVFEAFVQVDDNLNRAYEGTGLGVPLAVAFTRLHDGTLNIESSLGEGTTVSVVLPAHRRDQLTDRGIAPGVSADRSGRYYPRPELPPGRSPDACGALGAGAPRRGRGAVSDGCPKSPGRPNAICGGKQRPGCRYGRTARPKAAALRHPACP
jgi:signal transduction histidine kinase